MADAEKFLVRKFDSFNLVFILISRYDDKSPE